MEMLRSLLESEEAQGFLEENKNLILEQAEIVAEFSEVLKEFVCHNPKYFLEPTLENTYKNIKMFSEIATAQYLSEIVAVSSHELETAAQFESQYNSTLNDYL